jgi:hypothetical protein
LQTLGGYCHSALLQPRTTQQQAHICALLLQTQACGFDTRTGVGREGKAPQVSAPARNARKNKEREGAKDMLYPHSER